MVPWTCITAVMDPWRAPTVVLGVVVVLLLLDAWMTPVVAIVTYGNACFKMNKRLPVTPFLTLTTDTLVMCIVSCTSRQNCEAFNFKNSTKTCELLNTTLCDGDAVDLLNSPGWNYYDLQDSQDQEVETPLYDDPACINYGICSEKCLRLAGQTCRNTSQCTYLINGVSSCVLGVCKCAPLTNYYSTQRPVQPNNCTDILPWYFWSDRIIIKRIDPANVCYISFQLKTSSSAIFIHLLTDYYVTVNRYAISILPQGQFIINRVTNNVVYNMATTVYPGLLSSTAYVLIKFSWCNGQLRAGPQGNELLLSWNDPSPLTITNVLLQSASDNAQTWIKGNNMMDQWTPGGNVTTPGDYRATITKKVAVGKNSTNYSTTFYCKGARDCELFFMAAANFNDYYQISSSMNSGLQIRNALKNIYENTDNEE
ncbi:uncharacterized protein [Cherax quadricarinatus]|uniref:uncharacterized protein n=1 Tax=Cherax quadricarinatus TaxID=27406 RepID=UPI00387E80D1